MLLYRDWKRSVDVRTAGGLGAVLGTRLMAQHHSQAVGASGACLGHGL
jgi:hypothetical protein